MADEQSSGHFFCLASEQITLDRKMYLKLSTGQGAFLGRKLSSNEEPVDPKAGKNCQQGGPKNDCSNRDSQKGYGRDRDSRQSR